MTQPLPPDGSLAIEALLHALAQSIGRDPAPHELAAALADATRQHPGQLAATWLPRLVRAGEHVGLRVVAFEASPRALIDQGARQGTIATCLPAANAAPAWLVIDGWLGSRARIDGSAAPQPGGWVDADTLARLLGLADADAPALWILAEPVAPAAALKDTHGHAVTPAARLRGLMRLESRDLWAVVVYAIGVGIFTLATPIAVQALVNTVAFGAILQPLVVLTILLLAGLNLASGLQALQFWVVEILQQRLLARIVSDLGHRLPRLHTSALDDAYGPVLVNRFYDVVTLQKATASLLLGGLSVALQAAIGMAVLAFYHPLLLTFDIFLLGSVLVIILGFGRAAVRTSIDESKAKHNLAAWLQELARAPIAFKRAGGPAFGLQRADDLTRRYLDARRLHFRFLFRQVLGSLGLQATASAVLLGLGGWLVIERQLTLGQLVAAELIVSTVVSAIAKFGKHLEAYYDMVAAVEKLGSLADLPLEQDRGEATPPTPGPAALHLEGVALTLPGGPPVLRGLDLDLQIGEKIAITGPSASGKSSLAALLYGLRDPTAGRIHLDSVDLRDLALASLRRDVALVGPIEIFAGTILDNVRMARRDIPRAEVRRILEALGLRGALERLSDDLDARIQVGGRPLARSEAARLCLARALLARPRLLVVDDALDGLDDDALERALDLIFAADAPWSAILLTRSTRALARSDRALELRDGALHPLTA